MRHIHSDLSMSIWLQVLCGEYSSQEYNEEVSEQMNVNYEAISIAKQRSREEIDMYIQGALDDTGYVEIFMLKQMTYMLNMQ
jgi:hypothetical protein